MKTWITPAATLAAVCLFAAVIGCSHPQEIDLTPGYTGKVTVLCDRFSEENRPIQVGADGLARKATCPRSREPITVVRDGKAVQTLDARWSTTGDGIVLAIDFDVR